jgi:hypothetical protein
MTKASTHLVPDFKIRVTDEAHSRAIQEELFRRGAKWCNGGDEVIHTESGALYLCWWGIAHTPEVGSFFEREPMPEHTFANGKFSFDEEEAQPDADGWIEWNGGKCPVEDGVMVDYRLSSGREVYNLLGRDRVWEHLFGSRSNIVSYRIHKPKSSSVSILAQEQSTLQPKKEWQKDRLLDVLKEMTRLVEQSDYDPAYDLLTDEAAQLINDLKWK